MGLSSRDRHTVLAATSRRAVLDVLRRSPDALDASQVAAQVGRHVTTVRQHLEVLVDSGVVSRRVEKRTVRGRPRVLYLATARREPDDGDGLMAMMLAAHLAQGDDPSGQAELAGRRWGRALMEREPRQTAGAPTSTSMTLDVGSATQRIVDLFEEVGFAPTRADDTNDGGGGGDTDSRRTVISLNRCPFRHVAQTHPEVACSVHLGLMRGALESMEAPLRADRLEPFVTPTLCRAYLVAD